MLEVFVCILNKHHKMTPDGGVWPGGGGEESGIQTVEELGECGAGRPREKQDLSKEI